MVGLYKYFCQNFILLFLYISILGIILQAAYLFRIYEKKTRKIFEVLILLHLITVSLIFRYINSELQVSSIVIETDTLLRWFLSIAVIIAGAWLLAYQFSRDILWGMLSVVLTIPLLEAISGYVFLFVGSLISLTIRAGLCFFQETKKQKREITKHSIKEALDAQHSGILFSETNGNILLVNKRILGLMDSLMGEYLRDAEKFWQYLLEHSYSEITDSWGEEKTHCLVEIPDGEYWQFVKKKCMVGDKLIYQIIATDVTEMVEINRQLEEYQNQLQAQKSQLQSALENIEELKRQEALSLMWSHIHDVLGQRISILQRELNNNTEVDFERLEKQVEHLLKDLNFIEEDNPLQRYRDIIGSFLPLGIHFYSEGKLPEDRQVAGKIVDMIREAISNAVRHGHAENIFMKIKEEKEIEIWIENDGVIPEGEIRWGGGLASMLQKVEELNGKMEIYYQPRFGLYIHLPKKRRG
ncbi:MAG: hypothetical protein Q4A29_09195 [Eubacteriales bacterium]|nr:hypothetical protein [Eubacteriales bacterium]